MNKEVKSYSKGLVGLPKEIFTAKPSKTSDFEYSRKLDYFDEPENIIENLNVIYKRIINLINATKAVNEIE